MAELEPLTEHEVFTAKDGKRRLKIIGRKGFPITMLDGESPEQAWERFQLKRAENKATAAKPKPAAPDGLEGIAEKIREKIEQGADQPATDPPPRVQHKPPPKPRPTDADLRAVLEELLVLPAIPFGLPVVDPTKPAVQVGVAGNGEPIIVPEFKPRCTFCRDHFIHQGPLTAAEVVKMSKDSEPIRRVLERVHAAWAVLSASAVISGYVMKPAMHHLAPAPVLAGVGPVLGIPPREPGLPRQRRNRGHTHGDGPQAAPPPGSPANGHPGTPGAPPPAGAAPAGSSPFG